MKRSGLPIIAWILLGLLGISAFVISLGQQDSDTSPEASSYSPSGLSAFRQILIQAGYQVIVTQAARPKLQTGDVAIAFERHSKDFLGDDETASSKSPEANFQDYFWSNISSGNKGILFQVDKDFMTASKSAFENPPLLPKDLSRGDVYRVSRSFAIDEEMPEPTNAAPMGSLTLWKDGKIPFARVYKQEKGSVLVVRDGIGITNRFIDKQDNARAFASLVSLFAPPHARIVLMEASFGNVQHLSLMEAIGPWANAAWQQLIFLGIVVLYTLGQRFGLGEEKRYAQRGSRELVDALGDTLRRAGASQAALVSASTLADYEIRLVLKLPRDASRAERDRHLPSSLQNALARLDTAKQMDYVPQDQALYLIQRTQAELDEFLGARRSSLRHLAKLKR